MATLREIDEWIVRPSRKIEPGDVVYPITWKNKGGIAVIPRVSTVVAVTYTHIELEGEGWNKYYTMDTVWAVRPGE